MLETVNNTVTAFWPVLTTAILTIIWLVRLEAKVLQLESSKSNTDERLKELNQTLTLISTSLARLEGRIEFIINDKSN